MYNIEEGLFSNIKEIHRVTSKISIPFQKFLKVLDKLDTYDMEAPIIKQMDSLQGIIRSSKLSDKMKNRFAINMYIDAYRALYDRGSFNGRTIKNFLNIPDSMYYEVLRKSEK